MLLVRSFLIGMLFRKMKWGFISASLFGSVFFGAWHIYHGYDLMSSLLLLFLLTAAESVWFGWMIKDFERWYFISA